ncbi:hypothetical protein FAGAP_9973 [Fusarium agapanthi]|uniref:Uncharacterized protein n=1 Tax=Fusarium agapanthi TaxID=1803897 RepID=A0A9P5B215_9HYPO|nr:hypothetical protein FAGAP_9973 [Fusarium agapanthi]
MQILNHFSCMIPVGKKRSNLEHKDLLLKLVIPFVALYYGYSPDSLSFSDLYKEATEHGLYGFLELLRERLESSPRSLHLRDKFRRRTQRLIASLKNLRYTTKTQRGDQFIQLQLESPSFDLSEDDAIYMLGGIPTRGSLHDKQLRIAILVGMYSGAKGYCIQDDSSVTQIAHKLAMFLREGQQVLRDTPLPSYASSCTSVASDETLIEGTDGIHVS